MPTPAWAGPKQVSGEALLSPSKKKAGGAPKAKVVPAKLTIVEDKAKNGRGVYCHGLNEVRFNHGHTCPV